MFVVLCGSEPATKLIQALGTKVRGVFHLAQPHTVCEVARVPARDQLRKTARPTPLQLFRLQRA
jgi:hypothetical protein